MVTPTRRRWLPVGLVVGATLLGILHAALVGQKYYFGSYYDDAHYVLLGRALLGGHGFVDLTSAAPPYELTYPPAYPGMLAAIMHFAGQSNWFALRAFSACCFLALIVVTFCYARRRGSTLVVATISAVLLAVNPVAGGFGTMVMAEMPFVLVLMIVMLLMDRWERGGAGAIPWGFVALVAATALIYIKSAGVAIIPAMVVYLATRRQWRKAAWAFVVPSLLYAPMLMLRVGEGGSLLGDGYSGQLHDHGFLASLPSRFAGGLRSYADHVASDGVLGSSANLHLGSMPAPIHALLVDVQYAVLPLAVLGFAISARRHSDLATAFVPVYLLETLAYPYINERRIILIVPLVLHWIAVALEWIGELVVAAVRRRGSSRPHIRRPAGAVLTGVLAAILVLPQLPQLGLDFRSTPGHNTIEPTTAGSLAILRDLRPADGIVASEYDYTATVVTGKYSRRIVGACPVRWTSAQTTAYLHRLHATFATFGVYTKYGAMDWYSRCLVSGLDYLHRTSVRLYRNAAQQSVTFELIGRGSRLPHVTDLAAQRLPRVRSGTGTLRDEPRMVRGDNAGKYLSLRTGRGHQARVVWGVKAPGVVRQLSISAAGGKVPPKRIVVSLRDTRGKWTAVSTTTGRNIGPVVADPHDSKSLPYLVRTFSRRFVATAVSVRFEGQGTYELHDLHLLADPA